MAGRDLFAEQPKAGPKDLFEAAPVADTGDWERATLLPIEKNRRTGEWRLAVPGFIDAGISAAALPGDVYTGKTQLDPRVSYRDQNPETLDRAATLAGGVGSELPLAARGMVQPTVRNLVDANGRAMPKLVANSMVANNMTPATIPMRQAQLGPAAVLGDMSPRLQARLGAVATTNGPGQDMIVEAMRARQRGANARIAGTVDETLGPAPIPSQEAANIRTSQRELSPQYRAALANATSGDIGPVAASIEDEIMQAKGPAKSALQRVRAMLDFQAPSAPGLPESPPILDPNPTGWLKTRQAIDGMLEGETNTDVLRVLGDARSQIDEALTRAVPGIKEVDAQFAGLARENEALTTGQQLLDSGRTAIRPQEMVQQFADATPEVRNRLRQGLRAEIDRLIGTTGNDRVALKGMVKGDGSWNRDRLVTVYGEERAQRLIDLFDAEAEMALTENLAIGNSKTEVIRSAKEGIEPSKAEPGVIRSAVNLNVGDAIAKAADNVTGGLSKRFRDQRNANVAAALLSRAEDWSPSARTMSNNPGVTPLSNVAVLEALMERGKRGGMLTGGGF